MGTFEVEPRVPKAHSVQRFPCVCVLVSNSVAPGRFVRKADLDSEAQSYPGWTDWESYVPWLEG